MAFKLLPPATKLGQGNVFTGVCDSVNRGGYPSMHCRWYPSMPCSRSPGVCYNSMHCRWYPSMPCSRGSLPGPWGVPGSWGVPGPQGGLLLGGVPGPGGCGLLLWPSVVVFCYGLLIEGGLLVWPSRGQKAITEGHHTRRHHIKKAITPEGHHTRRPPHWPGGDHHHPPPPPH